MTNTTRTVIEIRHSGNLRPSDEECEVWAGIVKNMLQDANEYVCDVQTRSYLDGEEMERETRMVQKGEIAFWPGD